MSTEDRPDIAELRKLEAAATPVPWRADTAQRGDCVVWGPNRDEFLSNIGHVIVPIPMPEDNIISFDAEEHNTRLIAAARNALPSLLNRLEDAEARLEAVETLCDESDRLIQRKGYRDGCMGHISVEAIRAALDAER